MATYYVDFVGGDDTGTGLDNVGEEWQHCPGDPNATDTAGSATLSAGDFVVFKGGVDYVSGTITTSWSGSSGNVITYISGDDAAYNWGTGSARISSGRVIISSSRSYITFDGFEIWQTANAGIDFGTTTINNIILKNLHIYQPTGVGVDASGMTTACSDITVQDCTVEETQKEAIYFGISTSVTPAVTSIIVERCTVKNCGTGSGFQGEIDLKPPVDSAIIRDCTIYRDSVALDGSSSGIVVYGDNVEIYRNTIYGMYADDSNEDGITITTYGNGTTGRAITSLEIWSNLIYDNDGKGIRLIATLQGDEDMTGVKIYGNTIADNGSDGVYAGAAGATNVLTVADMKNNIFDNNAGYQINFASEDSTLTLGDYNIYYEDTGSLITYVPGAPNTPNWAEWTGQGYDANGYNSDPSLDSNYVPTSGSNAIDNGADLGTLYNTEVNGDVRPPGKWDIGAYEYGEVARHSVTIRPL